MIKRIQVFGDSVLQGAVLDSQSSKYRLLPDQHIRRLEAQFGVEIINQSKFGSTITKGMQSLRKYLDRGADCDCVLLEYGGNDCNFNWAQVAATPEQEHYPATMLAQFTQVCQDMVGMIRRAGIRPVLMTLPPIDAEQYLAHLGDRGLHTGNILRWLGDAQMIYRYQELYSSQIIRLAQQLDADLVDVRAPFLARRTFKHLICRDGLHPNEAGHQLIYDTFSDYMRRRRVNGVEAQPLPAAGEEGVIAAYA